jgi:hypothetical protein
MRGSASLASLVLLLASVGVTGVVLESSALFSRVGQSALETASSVTNAALDSVSSYESVSRLGNAGLESIQSLSALAGSELMDLARESEFSAPALHFLDR